MDHNGIKSHSDSTPQELKSCLQAILDQLEPQMPVRAFRAYWGHALAVRKLDRASREVVFSLPASAEQIKGLQDGKIVDRLTRACTAVGLQSWSIIPGK